MLNKFPLWKNLLVLVVIALGALYAAPNLYPDSPAVQIYDINNSGAVDQRLLERAARVLEQNGIAFESSEVEGNNALIRFADEETQIRAKARLDQALGENYVVALNLAPNTPDFLADLGGSPMKLGLDLRGGVHFLLEVDMDIALKNRLEVYSGEIRRALREEKLRYRRVELGDDYVLSIRFDDAQTRSDAESVIRETYTEFQFRNIERNGDFFLELSLAEAQIKEIQEYAINQNLTILRSRVNQLGVSEPLVQRQGADRIVVELPGIQDSALAKRILGVISNLEFRLGATTETPRYEAEEFEYRSPQQGGSELVEKDIIVTGENVSNASVGYDENNRPQVSINLDSTGGKLLSRATTGQIGRQMAIIFVEYKTRVEDKMVDGELQPVETRYIEKKLISYATIQAVLSNSFRITGLDSPQEASELALQIRAGALAAPIDFVEEYTIGPSLGHENIERGITSVTIGLLLVVAFMLLYYRVFGLFANIALTLNLVLIVAVMSILSATLTLPGIAGIVLTVGMAVDANVLIFSRIREELSNGVPVQSAINSGYARAFETIFDANITTLLVAVILFAVGTGPVKGFAITLCIGILTSMFTAIVVTRAIVNLVYGGRAVKKLWI